MIRGISEGDAMERGGKSQLWSPLPGDADGPLLTLGQEPGRKGTPLMEHWDER